MTSKATAFRPVILITYHYPPSKEVGGLRAMKVARALRETGHEVSVITARLPGETGELRHSEPGLTVRAVVPRRNPREFYAAWKQRRQSRSNGDAAEPPGEAGAAGGVPSHVPGWKRLIFSMLWLPDDKQGFIGAAIAAARPLTQGRKTIVYTSAPPFSAHLAGWRLRRRSGVKWVAEFRDPWTDNPWKPRHVRTALSDAIERKLEQRCLRRADLVVAVSEGIVRVLGAKMNGRQERLVLIRNGIDQLLPPRTAPHRDGPFRVVHVGSFYHGRDPRPFLRGLALLRSQRNLSPADIEIELVGACRWFDGISVEAEVAQLGLVDLVRFRDWIPHQQAQELVNSADLLLLLARNQPDQVPNKLYEYLGSRRPVIAFADRDGESAAMLSRIGGHFVLTGDEPDLTAAALAQAMQGGNRLDVAEDVLESWTSQSQMARLVEAVEKLP